VANLAGNIGRPKSYMFDRETAADSDTKEERLDELKELKKILKLSRKCAKDHVCEAAWNEDVHRPILLLALDSCIGVESRNVYAR
jgi:hypothetical protein